ncbi:MAG: DUF2188 domain-containing protein [Deltaproteobacteria bacterium]|nr:DUF2188 domain-containing protein [Deltaproteobacteria bacterium]
MDKKYRVIPNENGWTIQGSPTNEKYKTKKNAVLVAKKIAFKKNKPLIIHSKDGRVTQVSYQKNRIRSSHIKKRLNPKLVRNTIAEVDYERAENL